MDSAPIAGQVVTYVAPGRTKRLRRSRDCFWLRDNSLRHEHVCAKSTRVIEVMMRVHDVLDRLVRNEPLHLPDYSQRPVFILRSLDHCNEIANSTAHCCEFRRRSTKFPAQRLRFHTDGAIAACRTLSEPGEAVAAQFGWTLVTRFHPL